MKLNHIDKLDVAILEALQKNARISLSELGRQIGLSQPAMSERVKRLERNVLRWSKPQCFSRS